VASTDTGEQQRTYTEWYVWAARNLSSTGEVRHACAKAAMDAKEEGGDPAAAARSAAQNRSGPGWTDQADPAIRAYAEWYDWARTTLKLSGEPLHDAAAAALAEIDRGGDAAAAARAAGLLTADAQTVTETPPPLTSPPLPQLAPPPAAPPAAPAEAPPAAPPAPSPAPSMAAYSASIPPPTAYPPAYPYGPPPYPASAPAADRRPGPFDLPTWVMMLIGLGGGIGLLQFIEFSTAVVVNPYPLGKVFDGVLDVISLLMFASTFVALLGVIRRAAWARALTIVAGVSLCLGIAFPLLFFGPTDVIVAGVCLVMGLAIIVGAATAKPALRRP
jgi:hypothetical protein